MILARRWPDRWLWRLMLIAAAGLAALLAMTSPAHGILARRFPMDTLADQHLTLNADEAQYVVGLLRTALADARVALHRTHSPDYRERLHQEEALVRDLLARLQADVPAVGP
jgi:hypothetical protein